MTWKHLFRNCHKCSTASPSYILYDNRNTIVSAKAWDQFHFKNANQSWEIALTCPLFFPEQCTIYPFLFSYFKLFWFSHFCNHTLSLLTSILPKGISLTTIYQYSSFPFCPPKKNDCKCNMFPAFCTYENYCQTVQVHISILYVLNNIQFYLEMTSTRRKAIHSTENAAFIFLWSESYSEFLA